MSFRNIRDDGILKVANAAERLLLLPPDGTVVEELDTHTLYIYDGVTNTWINIGGGGGGTYNGISPTTLTVGGLAAGTAIFGQTFTQIIQQMVAPYINPSFTSFSIGQTSPIEVGTTISGSKNFTFGFNPLANVTPNSLSIVDVTGGTTLASGLPLTSPQSANIGTITLTSPGSYSWRGTATRSIGGTFNSGLASVSWLWRFFYGISANPTLTAGQIQALANDPLSSAFAGTYSFPATNYKYFAWPDSFGSPTAVTGFKDTSTNLSVAMAGVGDNPAYSNTQNGWSYALVSVTNVNSITTNYRVYRTKNLLGGSINIQVS